MADWVFQENHLVTKRELFAAMAMQGCLSNPTGGDGIDPDILKSIVATISVRYADALIAELAKKVGE